MTLSSRRPPNQSSTVGSRDPAATTSHRTSQQGRRGPDSEELPAAYRADEEERAREQNQHDSDGEDEQCSAAAAAVRVAQPCPRHQAQARAARKAGGPATAERRSACRGYGRMYSSGDISGCCPRRRRRQGRTAMTAANPYCSNAIRCTAAGLRSDDETRDHHATACRAGDQRELAQSDRDVGPVQQGVQHQVSGCQFSAATTPRPPSAKIIAVLTRDCLLTRAHRCARRWPIRADRRSPRRSTKRLPESDLDDRGPIGRHAAQPVDEQRREVLGFLLGSCRLAPCSRCAD